MKKICLILYLMFNSIVAFAEIQPHQAIRAVIGEDSSSEAGMIAVAHGIRNRGHLNGVYGLNAVRWLNGGLKRYSGARISENIALSVYQRASKAWFKSEWTPDPTNGAQFWEGVKFKKPYWAKGMVDCGVHGANRFYKE